jgi:hypothetical protein
MLKCALVPPTATQRPVTWSGEHVTTCFGREYVKYLTTTKFLGAEHAGSLGHDAIIFVRQYCGYLNKATNVFSHILCN